jgi:hypothetical protein
MPYRALKTLNRWFPNVPIVLLFLSGKKTVTLIRITDIFVKEVSAVYLKISILLE